jgi:RNA ligase (TIGR02306 family)
MSSSLIVEVCAIDEIKNHPNADKMDIAIVKGWQLCVAKRGYSSGDVGVYFPIDSLVPKDVAESLDFDKYLTFYKDRPDMGKVKAVKLRGEPSYGVFIPIEKMKEYLQDEDLSNSLKVGDNLAEDLGIEKWEPPLTLNSQEAETPHPLFEKYTDIENYRNFPNVLTEDDEVVVTEKIHGNSYTTSYWEI